MYALKEIRGEAKPECEGSIRLHLGKLEVKDRVEKGEEVRAWWVVW